MKIDDLEYAKIAGRVEVDGKPLEKYSDVEVQQICADIMVESGDQDPTLPKTRFDQYKKIISFIVKSVSRDQGQRVEGGYKLTVGDKVINRTEIGEFWNDLNSL